MSYFSEIYGDLELSARAKLVLVTSMTGQTRMARAGTPLAPWQRI